jgi:hypothetical protein
MTTSKTPQPALCDRVLYDKGGQILEFQILWDVMQWPLVSGRNISEECGVSTFRVKQLKKSD